MGSNEELEDIMNEFDTSGNKKIEFAEFLTLMSKKIKEVDEKDRVIQVFRTFDKDEDGFISFGDLRYVMVGLGETLSDDEINQMIKDADIDGDGRISYEEFYAMVKSV